MSEYEPNEQTVKALLECERKISWNEAIEEAAKLADTSRGYPTTVSENIRRLKR